MKKWLFGVAFLALATLSTAQAQEKQYTVIYVGGWDCGPCIAWKNNEKPAFVKSPQYAKVNYVEIDAPKLREVYQEKYWPEKYRSVLQKTPDKFGTPRFIVLKGDEIVFNERGSTPWTRAWAKIKEVVL